VRLACVHCRCETEAKRIERLVEVSANESLLCSVKVYCDWMRINPHIIATCAKVADISYAVSRQCNAYITSDIIDTSDSAGYQF